jgi:hypothetical protein
MIPLRGKADGFGAVKVQVRESRNLIADRVVVAFVAGMVEWAKFQCWRNRGAEPVAFRQHLFEK